MRMKLLTSGFEWLDCKYVFDPKTTVREQQWTVEIKTRPTIEIKTQLQLEKLQKLHLSCLMLE